MQSTSAYEKVEAAGPCAPWLTLVHGASQDGSIFGRQVSAFRARYRILLVDLAGHGASAELPGPFGPAEYTAAVLNALDHAGIERTHFWGTHTGTSVGLVLATTAPHRLDSLILEGAVIPGRPVPSVVECFERARRTLRERGLAAAREEWFERAPWFDVMRRHPDACRADAHRRIVDRFKGAPWQADSAPEPVLLPTTSIARIDLPTLLINGEHEVPDFIPAADELTNALNKVQRVTIPGGGGFPLWEFPDAVNHTAAEFLAGRSSPA